MKMESKWDIKVANKIIILNFYYAGKIVLSKKRTYVTRDTVTHVCSCIVHEMCNRIENLDKD